MYVGLFGNTGVYMTGSEMSVAVVADRPYCRDIVERIAVF